MSNSYPVDPVAHMMNYAWPFQQPPGAPPQPCCFQQNAPQGPAYPNPQPTMWGNTRYHYHTQDGGPPNMGKPPSKQDEPDLSSQAPPAYQSLAQQQCFQQPAGPSQQPQPWHSAFGRATHPQVPSMINFQIFHRDLLNPSSGCSSQRDGALLPDTSFADTTSTFSFDTTLRDFLAQVLMSLPRRDSRARHAWSGVEELDQKHPEWRAFYPTSRRHATFDPEYKLGQTIGFIFADAIAKLGEGPIYLTPF